MWSIVPCTEHIVSFTASSRQPNESLRQAPHVAQIGGDVMIATFLVRCEAESSGGKIPSGPGPAQMDHCGEVQPLSRAGGRPTAKRER